MSIHDETPTSELPAITDAPAEQPATVAATARRPWYRRGRRGLIAALAGVAAVSAAGIAIASGTSGPAPSGPPAPAGLALPAVSAPARTTAPRANRATRPTPSSTSSATTPKPVKPAWVAPMKQFRITSCYGMRWGRPHQGIDFAAYPGAKIFAAHAGTVISAGWNSGGYGNMVIIKHGAHLFTLYGHASKVLVHVGQKVSTGQPVALEGATGHVTGPHLHFEVWTAMWQRVSPGPFLASHGIHLSRCQ